MARFSDRIGVTSPARNLQVESMDANLRTSLWNWLCWALGPKTSHDLGFWQMAARAGLWDEFFHLPIDEVPGRSSDVREHVKNWFQYADWYEIYNIVEFIFIRPEFMRGRDSIVSHASDALNQCLEREMSGYRLIGENLAPITAPAEVNEIDKARTPHRGFEGVAEHIETALSLLGKKPEPDCRNSIKESISAVEAAVKLIAGEKSGGIDKAINVLDKKGLELHPSLREAIKKLYGYTSDKDGIRHPILEGATITFAEARFMLVVCSAFANLLIEFAVA